MAALPADNVTLATVIVRVFVAEHVPVVPVIVYTVDTDGLAVTDVPVVAFRPVPGDHV